MFIRRISVASNAIQTIDNETAYLIIYCLNCIRRNGNSTYKTSLRKLIKMRFFTIRYITFLRRIILGLNCVLLGCVTNAEIPVTYRFASRNDCNFVFEKLTVELYKVYLFNKCIVNQVPCHNVVFHEFLKRC